jgi:acetyl-CoA acyltransferase
MAGTYDVVIAAGVESMSRVPMGSNRQGADFMGPGVHDRYAPGLVPQGVAAELMAEKWKIGRRELDEFSVRSHHRAAEAASSGSFEREIVPIRVNGSVFGADETIRANTSVEGVAELESPFRTDELAARFPELEWNITAASSSQISDGASAILIVSERKAKELGLRPRARFVSFYACGDDPLLMLTGPIPATKEVLRRAAMTTSDVDHFEVNEAFASVPLVWQSEFGVAETKLNPRGGAIALGHPLGATGCRLLTTMLHALEDNDQRIGLEAVCEAGGMANAMIIERL